VFANIYTAKAQTVMFIESALAMHESITNTVYTIVRLNVCFAQLASRPNYLVTIPLTFYDSCTSNG